MDALTTIVTAIAQCATVTYDAMQFLADKDENIRIAQFIARKGR